MDAVELKFAEDTREMEAREAALEAALRINITRDNYTRASEVLADAREIHAFLIGKEQTH